MADNNATPDLQSILSTLAHYAPPVHHFDTANATERVHTPVEPENVQASQEQALPERLEDPRLRPQSRPTASPKPIDPATITTWQDGLRCVTKIAAQNPQFAASIRRMIAEQRKHEMRWYSERQALKQTQANRASSSAQAQSILQSLGGGGGDAAASKSTNGFVDNEAELAALDRKIYASQVEMETTMTAELKGLGVPFFGTDTSLIVADGSDEPAGKPGETQSKWNPVITETQLMELRRRMVGHLEDLYRD